MANTQPDGKQSSVLTGARAIVYVGKTPVGIFANCTWSVRQDKVPAFILGRYNPAEIVPTSQEPVTMNLTGYRVIGSGPYAIKTGNQAGGGTMATALANLLNETDFSVSIVDRRSAAGAPPIFTVMGCRVTGWSSGVAARGVSDIRLDIVGLMAFDESDPNGKYADDTGGQGAANLPDGT